MVSKWTPQGFNGYTLSAKWEECVISVCLITDSFNCSVIAIYSILSLLNLTTLLMYKHGVSTNDVIKRIDIRQF